MTVEADCPWVQLLKRKYCCRSPFLELKPKSYDSPIWKAILYGRDVIKLGVSFKVGDGRLIDIWRDPWVPNHNSICPRVVDEITTRTVIKPSRVFELIARESQSWRQDRIDTWFDPIIAAAIKKIQLPLRQRNDRLLWSLAKDGTYSSSTGYQALLQSRPDRAPLQEDHISRDIWQLNVQNRHRMLLWRIQSRCLPTLAAIHRRVPQVNPLCPICYEEDENEVHALIKCQHARLTWRHLWGIDVLAMDWDLTQCIEAIIKPSKIGMPPDRWDEFRTSSCLALDKIWQWRNLVARGQRQLDPVRIIREVQCSTLEVISARQQLPSSRIPSSPLESSRIWCPPPANWIKINFDASYCNGSSVVAAVARNALGDVLEAAIGMGFDSAALHAEARAARLAMFLASSSHYPSFIIEGDNLEVINLLKASSPPPWELENCIEDIKGMVDDFQEWNASHVYREANQVAHNLAKTGGFNLEPQTFCYKVAGLPMMVHNAAVLDWTCWMEHRRREPD